MNGTFFATAVFWSYGFTAVGFLLLAGRMAIRRKHSVRGSLLLAAVLATAAWAALGAVFGPLGTPAALLWVGAADTVRYGLWYAFVASLLASGLGQRIRAALPGWLATVALLLLAASIALVPALPVAGMLGLDGERAEFGARLGLAVLGLVLVEQLYRRTHVQMRWALKPMALALVATFAFDLALYADALLFGRLDADLWLARGLANALVIPLIAIATVRNAGWTIDMHVSRQAVVQSTALVVSGVFLLAAAGAGYIVRYFGGPWGRALQIELLFAALLVLALVATSGQFRARLRIFVSKHFFSYRYDYRQEWLRFTQTLAGESPVHGVHARAVKALADLVESPGGAVWLAGEGGYRLAAHLNWSAAAGFEPRDGTLARFLDRSGWVVTLPEIAGHPEQYAGLVVPEWLQALPDAWLVVPLAGGDGMLGFVVLTRPRAPLEVNWEVRDLLKAAARAAASYLAQYQATEALLEARKFDAFNRMSAFVVHDLKNLVAQLTLLLRNAERHHDNPEFQQDMLETVRHVVGRMNGLMLQLRSGATPIEAARPVDLEAVVRRVARAKGAVRPVGLDVDPGVQALGHEDRIEHVVAHLVQNALDATGTGGSVSVRVARIEGMAGIEVVDTGVGMSPAFVRDRLFRPFETTKPAGMGIGMYESSHYVNGIGGRMTVDSREGAGTRIRVLLPLAGNASASALPAHEAA